MDLDLKLLKYFHVVAKHESISKASKHLHLSQPAISLQIKKLEEQIAEPLFGRHNRGLKLSPTGRELFLQTTKIFKNVEETQDILRNLKAMPSGKITVGTYTTASSYLLAPKLTGFFSKFPGITISYNYEDIDRIIEKVKSYQIDCAIISEAPNDPQLKIEKLYKDELILVTSEENSQLPRKINPSQLSSIQYLSYPLKYDYCYLAVEKKFGKYLKNCPVPLETTSFDTLKQSLLAGLGTTFMPRYLVADEIHSGKLRPIEIHGGKIPITFSFLTRKDSSPSRATSEFRQWILNQFPYNWPHPKHSRRVLTRSSISADFRPKSPFQKIQKTPCKGCPLTPSVLTLSALN